MVQETIVNITNQIVKNNKTIAILFSKVKMPVASEVYSKSIKYKIMTFISKVLTVKLLEAIFKDL